MKRRKLLRPFLDKHPHDVAALRLMAQVARRQERRADAHALLQKCLAFKPGYAGARLDYANLLLERGDPEGALSEADVLLEQEPQNALFRALKADALAAIGDYAKSMKLWRELTVQHPGRPECWVRYGNALRVVGSRDDCATAFRNAIELDPAFTAAWLGLADLKTHRLVVSDIESMERQLLRPELSTDDRINLHFALGKAWADENDFEKSFANFAKGNAFRRAGINHDPDVLATYVSRCKQVFSPGLFRKHAGSGSTGSSPIFLVGMPRAGSTLVEQILASHSEIEGTERACRFGGTLKGDAAKCCRAGQQLSRRACDARHC